MKWSYSIIGILLLLTISCNKSIALKDSVGCRDLISILEIDSQDISKWLHSNDYLCDKIYSLLEKEYFDKGSIEYALTMINMKMSDEEFKVDRLIEFYYLFRESDDPFELEKKAKKQNKQ